MWKITVKTVVECLHTRYTYFTMLWFKIGCKGKILEELECKDHFVKVASPINDRF